MALPDTIYIGIGAVLGASISIFGVWLNNRSSIKQLLGINGVRNQWGPNQWGQTRLKIDFIVLFV